MPARDDQATLFGEAPRRGKKPAQGPADPTPKVGPAPKTEPLPDGSVLVRVVVERGIESDLGSHGYTYRCDQPVRVGDRVRVPLGRGNTPTGGIVVEVGSPHLSDEPPPERLKTVLAVTPANVSEPILALARWMASYYLCPLGMVLSAMLPSAVKRGTGTRAERLLDRVSTPPALDTLPARSRALVTRIGALHESIFPATPKRLATELALKTSASFKKLVTLGILRELSRDRIESRGHSAPDAGPADTPPNLSQDQAAIVEGIGARLGSFGVHLIRGVTGSGKTEVYLQLLERVLAGRGPPGPDSAQPKTAIVLVPEIALTPQTSARFLRRFSHLGVAVLHSGLSASQRHAEWDRASRGLARVVVGARSAIFAPVSNLGLIVVDEEHDSSYKQDQLPRYHGRDVAIKRAQVENCPVILGSATPSLESWHNATSPQSRAGHTLWELPERVVGKLPHVDIVDLAEERRVLAHLDPSSRVRQWSIGPRLESALAATLHAGGQAILLLNRRGFAHYIACTNAACGWVMGCDQCDVKLVFHKNTDLPRGGDVACHHCLSRQVLPRLCPNCGKAITIFGAGTQRVEEEVDRILAMCNLPKDAAIRADSDSMESARDYFDALGRFARNEARVLLGTQMIAKGLDFPNVRLVGVVSADTALTLPDFRSGERTFQLVSQVAGRAGRGEHPGRVIVQTMEPANPAIVLASRHDYRGFASVELASRARSGLPPITRMARIVCRDPSAPAAREAAARVAELLRSAATKGTRVLGPMQCPLGRAHGQFRFAAELIAPTPVELHTCLAAVRAEGLLVSDTKTAVDVDPVSLM